MSTLVSTLTLGGFDTLPSHDRRCTFWTTDDRTEMFDPDSPGPAPVDAKSSAPEFDDVCLPASDLPGPADPEFEKEAWLSMVMLEWGPCGQVAVDDGTAVGCALYAPPGAVPRVSSFPTAPISPDAVLLTSLTVVDPSDAGDLRTTLLNAVVRDLINRGVRALETFGLSSPLDAPGPSPLVPEQPGSGVCSAGRCMTEADFLEKYGFEVVAPHHRYPRLRLELDRDHGWKEDVEAALERLLAAAAITVTEADARVSVGAI